MLKLGSIYKYIVNKFQRPSSFSLRVIRAHTNKIGLLSRQLMLCHYWYFLRPTTSIFDWQPALIPCYNTPYLKANKNCGLIFCLAHNKLTVCKRFRLFYLIPARSTLKFTPKTVNSTLKQLAESVQIEIGVRQWQTPKANEKERKKKSPFASPLYACNPLG